MMDSRVDSTRVVGEATGVIGGAEPDVPGYWEFSVRIAKNWEAAQAEADTPRTRKVALRSAMVMSPDRGGVFDVMLRMVRLRLGGAVAGGRQYVPWIHDQDFTDAELLLKSRRVAPGRLLDAGFAFDHADWESAATDLVRRVRAR